MMEKKKLVERYETLYASLKILEYQLKQEARKSGQSAAFKLVAGKRGFIKPEIFKDIIKEK